MRRLSHKPRSLLVTIALSFAAVGYVLFVFVPGQKAVGKLRTELRKKQHYIVQAERLKFAIQQSAAELDSAREHTEAWRSDSPNRDKLISMLGNISELAEQAGIRMTKLEPQGVVEQDAICHSSLTVECNGDFRQVFEFIRRLEMQKATMWLSDVQLSLAEEGRTRRTISVGNGNEFDVEAKNGEPVRAEINLMIFADKQKNSN